MHFKRVRVSELDEREYIRRIPEGKILALIGNIESQINSIWRVDRFELLDALIELSITKPIIHKEI